MQPDATRLLKTAGIELPLIGFYDAPDASAFAPLVSPPRGGRVCVFAYFGQWLKGATLHLTRENFGCAGAGRAICGAHTRSDEDLVKFLVDEEGLKASRELMREWVAKVPTYRPEHANLLIGPLCASGYQHLKTVTFLVNPDQLGLLMLGAQYHAGPSEPPAVLAPFGSGCGQLVQLFPDLGVPQAVIGATDIAMRQYLPPDILAFTVTNPMFERLCTLDDRSFLTKPFWQRLKAARRSRRVESVPG